MPRAFKPGDPRAKAAGHKGGTAAAKTKRVRAFRRACADAGIENVTPREAALYRRGYTNGYSAGAKTGELRGHRKGYAEAVGEEPMTRAEMRLPRKPRTYGPVRHAAN